MKIGFFDSGIGGLTILKAVRALLPEYDYVFVGDTKNLPYGDKSEAEIRELTSSGVGRLFEMGARIAVVACNTASAESVRMLQKEEHADRKVLGVVIPTVEAVIEAELTRPLIIGTTRTVSSGKYENELRTRAPGIHPTSLATPELVPLIEAGQMHDALSVLAEQVDPRVGEIDGLVLGCTHYTLLKDALRQRYSFPIISQDEIIPGKLRAYLQAHSEISEKLAQNGTCEYFFTGKPSSDCF